MNFLLVTIIVRCRYPSTELQGGQKVTEGFVPQVSKNQANLMSPLSCNLCSNRDCVVNSFAMNINCLQPAKWARLPRPSIRSIILELDIEDGCRQLGYQIVNFVFLCFIQETAT